VHVTLVTWPELEALRSFPEGSQLADGISMRFDVRAEEPLGARWYAVVVAIDAEDVPMQVDVPHVALGDGRLAFRVFGTSAPRIREVRYSSGSGPIFDARFEFSESVIFAAGRVPIRVSADGVECRWYYEGETEAFTAMRTNFACSVPAPGLLTVEVLEDLASPGGGLLAAQVLEIDPREG
jgi:hypothetical protein